MDSRVSVLTPDVGFLEGPVWAQRGLSFASISQGAVYYIDIDGSVVTKVECGGGPNGLAADAESIYVAQNGGIFGAIGPAAPGVQRVRDGVAEYVFDKGFNAPNDICFGPDGRLYVTDPVTSDALFEPITGRVLACDLDTEEVEVVLEGLLMPNGIGFDPCGETMYVTQSYAQTLQGFDMASGFKTLDTSFKFTSGRPDGFAIDTEGRFWVCIPGRGGVDVVSAQGELVDRIDCGEGSVTTNVCFGGPDMIDVFITAAGLASVLTLRASTPGQRLRPFLADEGA